MKQLLTSKIFLTAILLLPLVASADQIEGKVNGLACAVSGKWCSIDKLDPMVAIEQNFVVMQPDGSFYLVPNVDRAVMARLVLDDIVVTGTVNERYKSIEADSIQVKRDGKLQTAWSEAIVKELRQQLFGGQR